jgi:hypothetical protein
VCLVYGSPYRDKKVVGVFVRFSCAANGEGRGDSRGDRLTVGEPGLGPRGSRSTA